jgi:RNA binding exosome subunit
LASSRKTERRKVEALTLKITAFCHATEECSRVEESMKNLLPEDIRSQLTTVVKHEKGYYGNPITIMTIEVKNPVLVGSIMKYIASKLEETEKRILKITSRLRYDPGEKKFTVRFSKQSLLRSKFQLSDTDDVVKLIVHLKNIKSPKDLEEFLSDMNLIA